MPSTLSYAKLGRVLSKKNKENSLTTELIDKLTGFSKQTNITSVDAAQYMYNESGYLMSKHRVNLEIYCKCLSKAIDRCNNLPFDKEELVINLISLINISIHPLRELINKK